MTEPVAISMIGAGLIGERHARLIRQMPGVRLASIVDPSEDAKALADRFDTPWFADMAEMLTRSRPEGVIIATPNRLHVDQGLAAVRAGIPALIEKPISDDADAAEALVLEAEAAGVPLLVGHHRRHNPRVARAKAALDTGRLGRIVAVHGFFWLLKPDDYFLADWRRAPGAGPVFINLIHDIDLLRHLCGDIEAVTAIESSATRGFDVEDTFAALLRFRNGALGTITASDTIAAPWSWELTAAENPAYSPTDQGCYFIGGTQASLSLPSGEVWEHRGAQGWWEPITAERTSAPPEDPLPRQIAHFAEVIRGDAEPLVTGRDGVAAVRVLQALKSSARTGREEAVKT